MSDATRILQAIEQGDPHAAKQLLPLVYDELRKLVAFDLAGEELGQTLQATALVNFTEGTTGGRAAEMRFTREARIHLRRNWI